jgi:hypothetical protein
LKSQTQESGIVSQMLSSFFAWCASNWGNLASVFGAVLTIYYSREARLSSIAARDAAQRAQSRIQMIDWVVHLSGMISLISDVVHRLTPDADWKRVSNDCTKLRSDAALCLSDSSPIRDHSVLKKIKGSPQQLAALCEWIDRQGDPDSEPINLARVRKTMSDQLETFTVALNVARQSAAGTQNDH